MPHRSRRHSSALAAGLLLAGALLFTADPERAAASGSVRVMQFNICGSICNHGMIDKPGAGNDIVEDVRNRVVRFKPDILTLNEVCVAQFDRLKSLLGNGDWKMSGVFRAQRNDRRCKGGTPYGDAVLTAGHVGKTEVLPLPNFGGERRAVLCLHTSADGPVLACTLHLITGRSGKEGPGKKRLQMATAARALNNRAAQGPVIVGGDFNLTPGEMGALNGGGAGRFFDVDPQSAGTHGRKIDYILFSRAHFANPSCGPEASRFSDHKVLLGQATRR